MPSLNQQCYAFYCYGNHLFWSKRSDKCYFTSISSIYAVWHYPALHDCSVLPEKVKYTPEVRLFSFKTPILPLAENCIDTCIPLYPDHGTLQEHWNRWIISSICSSDVTHALQGLKLTVALNLIWHSKQ